MDKVPHPVWAIVLAFLGVIIALCCLFYPGSDSTVKLQILTIASSLVSGALGAFAGAASAKADVKADNATINQTSPPDSK